MSIRFQNLQGLHPALRESLLFEQEMEAQIEGKTDTQIQEIYTLTEDVHVKQYLQSYMRKGLSFDWEPIPIPDRIFLN